MWVVGWTTVMALYGLSYHHLLTMGAYNFVMAMACADGGVPCSAARRTNSGLTLSGMNRISASRMSELFFGTIQHPRRRPPTPERDALGFGLPESSRHPEVATSFGIAGLPDEKPYILKPKTVH